MDGLIEVIFLSDARVSIDGIHAETIAAGQTKYLPPALAVCLIRDKIVESSIDRKAKEDKDIKDAAPKTIIEEDMPPANAEVKPAKQQFDKGR